MKARPLPVAEDIGQSDPLRPEKNLLLGILERAIRDVARMNGVNPRLDLPAWRRAVEWLEIGDPLMLQLDPHPWSYQWVCEHLGLDPSCIHKHMRDAHTGGDDKADLIKIIRRRLKKVTFAHRDLVNDYRKEKRKLGTLSTTKPM